ncbi:MAG: hypothetical protein WC682_01970 [Parcubacteria group bacterium]
MIKISDLIWGYLGNPESVCALCFESEKSYVNALFWIDVGDILWEVLYEDESKNDNIVPNTVLIPANLLQKFEDPDKGMIGKFNVTTIKRL